jgi:hypothetical protein
MRHARTGDITRRIRLATLLLASLASMAAAGCGGPPDPATSVSQDRASISVPDDDQLRTRLAAVLDWTYANRHLNLRDHAAWQIMHGALVYKQSLVIETERGGERLRAIEYLLAGGKMKGWSFEPGSILDEATGRRGLRAMLEAGSKTGQGHAEQWLANLAQCGLKPTQTIVVDGQTYTIADYVAQVQQDVPRNLAREYSWTLVALTAYLPTSATWTASDGQSWSIERLVELETEQELSGSACGGTHRLDGLTLALNRHVAQGGKLEGVWAAAEQKVQDAIRAAQQFQNPDGSFSSNYFQRGGKSADLISDVAVTGHILEFLTLALTDAELQEPWVKRAATRLCEILEKTQGIDFECGSLYHAAHGLDIYHTRRFEPRTYSPGDAPAGPRARTAGST